VIIQDIATSRSIASQYTANCQLETHSRVQVQQDQLVSRVTFCLQQRRMSIGLWSYAVHDTIYVSE